MENLTKHPPIRICVTNHIQPSERKANQPCVGNNCRLTNQVCPNKTPYAFVFFVNQHPLDPTKFSGAGGWTIYFAWIH